MRDNAYHLCERIEEGKTPPLEKGPVLEGRFLSNRPRIPPAGAGETAASRVGDQPARCSMRHT